MSSPVDSQAELGDGPWGGLLTRQEIRIAQLVCSGQGRREIAKRLSIGLCTFDSHRHRLLTKLRVANEVGLLRMALTRGWVTL